MISGWKPATPGQIKPGDTVRVLLNAFKSEVGEIHNGRLGVVVKVEYGDVIVNSTDSRFPKLEGAHYSPHHLEMPAE